MRSVMPVLLAALLVLAAVVTPATAASPFPTPPVDLTGTHAWQIQKLCNRFVLTISETGVVTGYRASQRLPLPRPGRGVALPLEALEGPSRRAGHGPGTGAREIGVEGGPVHRPAHLVAGIPVPSDVRPKPSGTRRWVGMLLDALDRAGTLDETMISSSGDDGYFFREHGPRLRAPLRLRAGDPRPPRRPPPVTCKASAPSATS